ncbi:MAG: CoA transferase [Neomegalonema sp.]|nr:CoA transferase [Neomegalonema sp.]
MAVASSGERTGPLAGLKILDLTRILAGPTSTQLMGDLGADIWKIERPGAGDDTRGWGPPYLKRADGSNTAESAYFLSSNRNKKSLTVDIANSEGAALVRALALGADVLIHNFKPGGLAAYGLDYDSLKMAAPGLVYCSISGFGQTGPNAHLPGYDLMAQAFGGVMSLTGAPDGEPMKVGVGIADVVCGLYATIGVLSALRWRDQTGQGQEIDISLVDAQIAWLINEGVNFLVSGEAPKRRGNQHPNIVPYQVLAFSDGHVVIAVGNDAQFARFAAIMGAPELADDPRYATNSARIENRETLIPEIERRALQMKRDAFLDAMARDKVPAGPIHTVPEVFETTQVAARGMRIDLPHPEAGTVPLIGNPLKLSETPVAYRNAPPLLGADTEKVVRAELGDDAYEKAAQAGAFNRKGAKP